MSVIKPSELLAHQSHRDWAAPSAPWVMTQTWRDLLFAHWTVPAAMLLPHLPAGLTLDTFDGQAWVGVVPFYITDIRPPFLPLMPFISSFIELNVRTYVTDGKKPGVWFFSLDASSRLAVEGARLGYLLPYFKAQMDIRCEGDTVHYFSRRTDRRTQPGEFRGSYRPVSDVFSSQEGTLERWLTERYCLYTATRKGTIYRAEIHHLPWALQHAEAEIKINNVTHAHGITLPDTPPLLHFAKQLNMLAWFIERV
jgi:uncharacterized protein